MSELNRGKRRNMDRKSAATPISSPTGVERATFAVPKLHPFMIFFFFLGGGGSSSRRSTREAGTQNWRGFEKDWEVSEAYWLGCCPKHDVDGEDQLEDGCGHLAPSTTIFGPWTHGMYEIRACNQFLMLLNTILKDEFYSCPIIYCPNCKALGCTPTPRNDTKLQAGVCSPFLLPFLWHINGKKCRVGLQSFQIYKIKKRAIGSNVLSTLSSIR